jgi:uncharacterized protein (DUF305 family)
MSEKRGGVVNRRGGVPLRPVAVVGLLGAIWFLASCGGGDDEVTGSRPPDRDRAFLQAMVPHHESALEMAETARDLGEHPQVRRLASGIMRTQEGEIRRMRAIHERLFDEELRPDERAHERMGLSAVEAGMSHDGEDMLDAGRAPFDRAFIDAMVPHHQGAIRMARAALAHDGEPQIHSLAESIIAAQATEIEQMNAWRAAWYGAPSPAGGVPAAKAPAGGDMSEGEEHGGH